MSENEKQTRLRNGVNTGTQNYQSGQDGETFAQYTNRRTNNVAVNRGLHETFDYYDDCYFRERNKGTLLEVLWMGGCMWEYVKCKQGV